MYISLQLTQYELFSQLFLYVLFSGVFYFAMYYFFAFLLPVPNTYLSGSALVG